MQAEEVAGIGAGPAELTRLRALRERLARAEKVRSLLASLEAVPGTRGEHLDLGRSDREYADAFRRFGIDLELSDPEQAAVALASRWPSIEIAAALDDWAVVRHARVGGRDERSWRRLVEAVRRVDPDPWRNDLRSLLGRPPADVARAARGLANDAEVLGRQSVPSLVRLAETLRTAGEAELAVQVLRLAWKQSPSDFWVNLRLGMSSWSEEGGGGGFQRQEEAIRFLTAAVVARPASAAAHNDLGLALQDSSRLNDVLVAPRLPVMPGAIARTPTPFQPEQSTPPKPDQSHLERGDELLADGRVDDAIAEYREAVRLRPDGNEARIKLGQALLAAGKDGDAIAEYRELVRLRRMTPRPVSSWGMPYWPPARMTRHRRIPCSGSPAIRGSREPLRSSAAEALGRFVSSMTPSSNSARWLASSLTPLCSGQLSTMPCRPGACSTMRSPSIARRPISSQTSSRPTST